MISKLTKIISAFAVFGALAFSSSYADGDYMAHKKNNKKAHKVVEAEKPAMDNSCCYEASPISMKKSGLGSGMTIGVGVDGGFSINSNSDFIVPGQKIDKANVTGSSSPTDIEFKTITFAQKRDSLYGAYASLGWMMANGLEANAEIAYHQFKFKDKTLASNSIESNIVSGMLNVTYYADLFDGMFLPYVTVGAGIARNESKGNLKDSSTDANMISFKDLTKTTFAYQAGAGIATSFDNVVLGVGYKFFGISSFSDSNSDLVATVKDTTSQTATLNPFNFGSMKVNTHNVTAFVKFAF